MNKQKKPLGRDFVTENNPIMPPEVLCFKKFPTQAMSRDAEVAFLLDGLNQNVRNDGRTCDSGRSFDVELDVIPSANSSCRVSRPSETEVVVAVKAELLAPLIDRPSAGIVKFSCEFSSLTTEESSIEALVQDQILSQLNLEQLCVYDSMLAWTLNIDCLVESSNGSLIDAVALAIKMALKSLVLPKVLVHPPEEAGEKPRVAFDENLLLPIDAASLPLSLTFGISGEKVFLDPSALEEKFASAGDGLVTVFLNPGICGIVKTGEATVDPEILPSLISIAGNLGAQILVP